MTLPQRWSWRLLPLAGLVAALALGGPPATGQAPEAFYPTYDQILTHLRQAQREFPHIVHLREIGRSAHGKPIMAAKISDNAAREEDEPAWLLLGLIHGAEPLGVRVALRLLHEVTRGYAADAEIAQTVNAYELWLIPVLNIWGYEHNRRKNGDRPGVDLNRNFDFRWDRCGTPDCLEPTASRYRGPTPFSEPETQAIRDLALEVRPLFGLDYHQGNPYPNSQIMRPWAQSSGDPLPVAPDRTRLLEVAQEYARAIVASRQAGGFCQPGTVISDAVVCQAPQMSLLAAFGQSSNWHYATVGTFHYIVEISARLYNERYFYTPDPADDDPRSVQQAEEYVRHHAEAARRWLRGFVAGNQNNGFTYRGPGITGRVRDRSTGQPLEAQIEVEGFAVELTRPRTSHPRTGRFFRLLPPGTYAVRISREAYQPEVVRVTVADGPLATVDVALAPRP